MSINKTKQFTFEKKNIFINEFRFMIPVTSLFLFSIFEYLFFTDIMYPICDAIIIDCVFETILYIY